MHYFEYATKDTTLYESSASMNTGLDEILEIRKDMNEDASVVNVSRALIKFDLTYISQSVSSGLIPSGSSTRYYLNLYDANSTQLNISQTLYGYPVSQSWEMGSGRLDSAPRITDGASWRYRDNDEDETPWFGTYNSLQGNTFASGTLTISDGDFHNQEVTIGGVDFVFVSGSTSVFDNSSAEIFVTSGSTTGSSVTSLRDVINNSSSLHSLPISASVVGSNPDYLILSGSSAGTNSNLSAVSSSVLFTFDGTESKALEGGTDTTVTLSGGGGSWYSGSALDSATATITISDYTELNAGDKVNLIAADGTNYDFTNGDQSSVNGTWESATSNNQTATNLMNVINTTSGPAGTRFLASVDGTVAATATITISAYTELNSTDKVNLVAADGTNYDFTNGDQSSVNGTWESATSNNQTATNLMNVINTSSGPAGTRFTATVDGAVVTVTQATVGTAGNTTVTLTDTGTAGMSKTNFTGGVDYVITITQATSGTAGNTTVTLTDSGTAGMTKTNFSGGTWSEYGYVASQSFTHEPSDLRMDVSDIVNKWLDSTIPNEGFMIKRSGSIGNSSALVEEGNSTKFGHFSFFGRDTHTVYQPKLEVVWDDSTWATGSLSALSSANLEDMVFYMKGLRPEYKETSKVKFRVVGRERFPEKTYVTSGYSTGYTTVKTLPSGSTYYEIKDAYTEDVIVPFGDGTKVSCDSTGNYFNVWMNGLQSERFYRINYKVVSGSGTAGETVQYFDEKHSFKVVR